MSVQDDSGIIGLDQMVIDDRQRGIFRVNRRSMVSSEVFDRERALIFDRCWLYLGQESEVPSAGDYRRRAVAGRPLILLRNVDGEVGALYDSCSHRGTRLCRQDSGNTKHFQCIYHAWTFDTHGKLIHVPSDEAYSPEFDRSELGLRRPPAVDSYRGFVFVNFDPDCEALRDYLAGATEYLDLIADQSEIGMRIIPGSNKYAVRANWKLMVENSADGYHARSVHQTYFDYLKSINSLSSSSLSTGRGRDLGNGHTVLEMESPHGRPVARWAPMYGEDAREEMAAMRRRLVDRLGEDRAYRIADTIRLLFIFPNLVINDIVSLTVRYFEPVVADYMTLDAWALGPAEETEEQIARRLNSFLIFIGPGGFATPDDVEVLEECQRGFRTIDDWTYSDISRGMTREPLMNDELQMRTFWRAWQARMLQLGRPERITEIESPNLIPAEATS